MPIPPDFHRCSGKPTIAAEGFPPQQIDCPHQGYCLRYLERGNGMVQEPRREGGQCFDFITEEGIKMMEVEDKT